MDTIKVRILLAGLLLMMLPVQQAAGKKDVLSPDLQTSLSTAKADQFLPIIVTLTDHVDLSTYTDPDKDARAAKLVADLKAKANQSQQSLLAFLAGQGIRSVKQLWLINGMALNAPPGVISLLAVQPDIDSIQLDTTFNAPGINHGTAAAPEWNLNAVLAPELWNLGYRGSGIVVANLDSGVDAAHPDLGSKWRGGGNSWYDPHGEHVTPYDSLGHGTQTMGIMVGGDSGGMAIGMAPEAQWIAAKIFNDAGEASLSDIHLSLQWLLDPDGDPDTADGADVVNASWGLPGFGQCDLEFDSDIAVLKTAGIGVVFSAGNDGPAENTSVSPGNNPQSFAAGALDSNLAIANFSSRGASACDGSIFPQLSAPGVDVKSADLSFGGMALYATVTGTSYAAPHVAGAMALLLNAFPNASVAAVESALRQTAQDLGDAGADNSYGFGLLNVYAAYRQLASGNAPVFTSTPVTGAIQDQPYSYSATAGDPDGDAISYALDAAPAGMNVDSASGLVSWTPGNSQVGAHPVALRASDATGLSATQSFTVTVANVNDAPVALGDAYSTAAGSSLMVGVPGVLGNDSDPDGDALTALLASGPSNGSLTLNPQGDFSYTPAAGFSGTDSFTYRANDGALFSAPSTVNITVYLNQAPVAGNDAASTPKNTAKVINVLSNDSDPDGSLNPASIVIAVKPDKGGTVTVNADGTVTYKPKLNFKGTEKFAYTVRDGQGATSNTATVTVTVTK